MALRRSRSDRGFDFWPGFVDALSTFLLTILFLLSVFMLAQFFLSRELSGKDDVLGALRRQVNELSEQLALERGQRRNIQDTLNALTATLDITEADKRRALAEVDTLKAQAGAASGQASSARQELDRTRSEQSSAQDQIAQLNAQIAALRQQLNAVEAALATEQTKEREAQLRIADLGRRLNLALAQRVQELSRYRSDFFGRLRDVIGSRADVRIVGDRFVFPSEVLFAPGSAVLEPQGLGELEKVASALIEVGKSIPDDIPWVLRVDGHTDKRPINSPQFPSNWELSSARAIAVVRFLMDKGLPAGRLAAAGFGEFQPIDPGESPEQLARNRRIELKLTER